LFEGYDLGVIAVVVEVCAFADDLRCAASAGILGKDTAYLGIRGGEADGFGGEGEGSLHEDFVMGRRRVSRHDFEDSGFAFFALPAPLAATRIMYLIVVSRFGGEGPPYD
jgi:hypothetical protein